MSGASAGGTAPQGQSGAGPAGSGQVLAIIDLIWNGQLLTIKEGAELTLGGLRNKAVNSTRATYQAQEFHSSQVSAQVLVQPGLNVLELFGTAPGELQANCDTGQQFVWADAFVMGNLKLRARADGSLDVVWAAGTPTEI